jgi:hypothetical protein
MLLIPQKLFIVCRKNFRLVQSSNSVRDPRASMILTTDVRSPRPGKRVPIQ